MKVVNILVHQGELDHVEVTGAKLVREMRKHREAGRFIIDIPERDPKPVTTGDQYGRDGI